MKINEESIKKWFKEEGNIYLFVLMVMTIIFRIYYFFITASQPTWWDEGDYLAIAKEFAIPSPETPEWWGHFTDIRPLFLPFLWSFFIRLDISESMMRLLTEVVPSIILVYFVYKLGSSLFNKRVGLIAGYLTSFYWVIAFYQNRFLTDIPAMMFGVMAAYYFWEYYVKRKKNIGIYLAVALGTLGFHTRFPLALIVGVFIIFA